MAAEQELCQQCGRVPATCHPPHTSAGSTEQRWSEIFIGKCIIQHFISSTLLVRLEQKPLRAFLTVRAVCKGILIRAAHGPGPHLMEERA